MASNQSGPVEQIFCQHCRGGNPPTASACIWCGQTIAAPLPTQDAGQHEVAGANLEDVRSKVEQILMQGENLEYIAVESKPIQINIAPDCVILTNRRFIIYRPKAFGRVNFEDYIWRELHDAQITEGVLRATFSVMTVDGRKIEVTDLPKEQARRVYQFAQQMEEYVLEERRLREMEEKRAESGGIYMTTPGAMPVPPSFQPSPVVTGQAAAPTSGQQPAENPVDKLAQLKQMLDRGLITQDAYDAKRDEILRRM